MQEEFSRTAMLLGAEALEKLSASRVAVFGLGGVGGAAAEALARSGIGCLDLIDNDVVSKSNINRQIFATQDTIGRYKTDVAAERIAAINPKAVIYTYKTFYMPDTSKEFDFSQYDYIIDAIDTVTGKIELIVNADRTDTPIISSMGTGNKLDPTKFVVTDIYKTSVCPLARVMRRELKARNIRHLKVVYSEEPPIVPQSENHSVSNGVREKQVPGSVAFVPPVAGLILAGTVVKDLIEK